MGEIVQWVKNITYYFILVHFLLQLIPNRKYERYIRLFSGIIFVLLVVSPLTKGFNLEQKLAYAYEKIRFEQDTEEFSQKLWGMENQRIMEVISQYEEAVAQDVMAMAKSQGLNCKQAQVTIESRPEEDTYGQVVGIELLFEQEAGDKEWEKAEAAVSVKQDAVRPVQIRIETDGEGEEETRRQEAKEREMLYEFQRKVAEYYGLEERSIRIAW